MSRSTTSLVLFDDDTASDLGQRVVTRDDEWDGIVALSFGFDRKRYGNPSISIQLGTKHAEQLYQQLGKVLEEMGAAK